MRRFLAVLVAMFPVSAYAADVWVETPGVEPEATSDAWQGIYGGLYAGGGAIVNDISLPGGSFNGVGGEGLLGGAMIGYNFQMGRIVFGVQGEVGLADLGTELNIPGTVLVEAAPDWTADVSLRAGLEVSQRALAYIIGGYSYADYGVDISGIGGPPDGSYSQDYHGWHLGAGLDALMTDNVFVGVEYRYTQYGGENWGVMGLDVEPSSHTGRLRAGFIF